MSQDKDMGLGERGRREASKPTSRHIRSEVDERLRTGAGDDKERFMEIIMQYPWVCQARAADQAFERGEEYGSESVCGRTSSGSLRPSSSVGLVGTINTSGRWHVTVVES